MTGYDSVENKLKNVKEDIALFLNYIHNTHPMKQKEIYKKFNKRKMIETKRHMDKMRRLNDQLKQETVKYQNKLVEFCLDFVLENHELHRYFKNYNMHLTNLNKLENELMNGYKKLFQFEVSDCTICCSKERQLLTLPCCKKLLCSFCTSQTKLVCPFCRSKLEKDFVHNVKLLVSSKELFDHEQLVDESNKKRDREQIEDDEDLARNIQRRRV